MFIKITVTRSEQFGHIEGLSYDPHRTNTEHPGSTDRAIRSQLSEPPIVAGGTETHFDRPYYTWKIYFETLAKVHEKIH